MIDHNYFSEVDGEKIPFTQLTIGQMIEFLDNDIDSSVTALAIDKGEHLWRVYGVGMTSSDFRKSHESVELSDALFAAVKEILEQKN